MLLELAAFWVGFVASAPSAPASTPSTKARIRDTVHQHLSEVERCYQLELEATPELLGTVTVYFTIGVGGRVDSAHAEGMTPGMNACVETVFRSLELPSVATAERVNVTYPLTFRSSR